MKSKDLLALKSPFVFITGPAGSGKSYLIRECINLDPRWAALTATTGVAARILGADVQTVHSQLGFFDANSLKTSRAKGTLAKNLKKLRRKFKRIVIDETSMLDAEVLGILIPACAEAGIGVILVGDFLQLPPVMEDNKKTVWIFETAAWDKFKNNVIILDTQYRHTNEDFIKGLNFLRVGNGEAAMPHLKKAGVKFLPGGELKPFDGTSIVGTNKRREEINKWRYSNLTGNEYTFQTERVGFQSKDWKNIEESVSLKIGARVMVLRNLYGDLIVDPDKKVDTDAIATQAVLWNPDGSTGIKIKPDQPVTKYSLLQANGDTGVVEQIFTEANEVLYVDVRRDDGVLIRVEVFEADNGKYHTEIDEHGHRTRIMDEAPTGWVTYLPLTQAWALTVHKSQGLTLSHPTQIILEEFYKKPAMVYVACSRVKNPQHLSLVGAELPVNGSPWLRWLCNADPAVVKEWK
jgi:ATP-dependent DNA helicase PIF1